MDIETIKDEFAAFREKVTAEKKVMEADFDTSCDVIINYGYGCCAFAHNICGSKPRILAGMPDTPGAPRVLPPASPPLNLSQPLGRALQLRVLQLLRMGYEGSRPGLTS